MVAQILRVTITPASVHDRETDAETLTDHQSQQHIQQTQSVTSGLKEKYPSTPQST